jgi:hypothetical protein
MKKTVMMGLLGLALGIGVAVGTATVGSEEAVAAPCCSSCEGMYDACAPGCNGDAACELECQRRENRCWSICSFSC